MLLRYGEKDTRHRGNYKTHSNSVAAFDESGTQIDIVFQTATPFDTPRLMSEQVTTGANSCNQPKKSRGTGHYESMDELSR